MVSSDSNSPFSVLSIFLSPEVRDFLLFYCLYLKISILILSTYSTDDEDEGNIYIKKQFNLYCAYGLQGGLFIRQVAGPFP